MKKTISILLILISSTHIFAQLSKGAFMPGISLNYGQNKNNTSDSIYGSNQSSSYKRSNMYTGINFGYFIKNNFAIGLNVGFQKSTNDYSFSNSNSSYSSNNNSHQINNRYNIGLFTRYYKMINDGRFGFFFQGNTMYSRSYDKNHQTYAGDNSNSSSYLNNYDSYVITNHYSIGLTPGIIYFITNKIGIETSFGAIAYELKNAKNHSRYNQTGKTNSQDFNVDFSSSTIRLGINYYLGRANK